MDVLMPRIQITIASHSDNQVDLSKEARLQRYSLPNLEFLAYQNFPVSDDFKTFGIRQLVRKWPNFYTCTFLAGLELKKAWVNLPTLVTSVIGKLRWMSGHLEGTHSKWKLEVKHQIMNHLPKDKNPWLWLCLNAFVKKLRDIAYVGIAVF